MRKKIIALILCLVFIFGWHVWDRFLRTYGEDHFDQAFEKEFDAEFIVNHFDILKDSGFFYCSEGDTMRHPARVAAWPKDRDCSSSIQCYVEVNGSEYYDEDLHGNRIYWSITKDHQSTIEDLEQHKYQYSFIFVAPRGQILLWVSANTRRECMEMGRRQLLWLMSIAKGEAKRWGV